MRRLARFLLLAAVGLASSALHADPLPAQVKLTAASTVSIRQGDAVVGETQLPAGTSGKPLRMDGETLLVDFGGLTASVPVSATDFRAALAAAAPAVPDRIAPLVRSSLIGLEGAAVRDLPPDRLAGVRYYALYYSAQWCPPCHAFTPKLVEFYNQFKPSHPQFELIFVSSDNDAAAQKDYMREMRMPWPVLSYEAIFGTTPRSAGGRPSHDAIEAYSGDGIPDLVLVDASGKVLADSYDAAGQYTGPGRVLAQIPALVK